MVQDLWTLAASYQKGVTAPEFCCGQFSKSNYLDPELGSYSFLEHTFLQGLHHTPLCSFLLSPIPGWTVLYLCESLSLLIQGQRHDLPSSRLSGTWNYKQWAVTWKAGVTKLLCQVCISLRMVVSRSALYHTRNRQCLLGEVPQKHWSCMQPTVLEQSNPVGLWSEMVERWSPDVLSICI